MQGVLKPFDGLGDLSNRVGQLGCAQKSTSLAVF